MKTYYFLVPAIFLFFACASSQNTVILNEAQKKVSKLKPLIELTDEQAAKMVDIEAEFLKASKALKYSTSYNTQLKTISEKRVGKVKEVLSHQQFLKFDLIDNNRLIVPPIRVE